MDKTIIRRFVMIAAIAAVLSTVASITIGTTVKAIPDPETQQQIANNLQIPASALSDAENYNWEKPNDRSDSFALDTDEDGISDKFDKDDTVANGDNNNGKGNDD